MSHLIIGSLFFISFLNISFSKCDLSGIKIIKNQKQKLRVSFEHEIQEVIIKDIKSSFTEKRILERFVMNTPNGNSKSLLNFKGPKEIKGSALLSWDVDNSQSQWLYLSSLKKLQRIASGSKKKYFMGSDFTFADLEGEQINDYNYKCIKEINCNKGSRCYMLEAIPKSRKVSRNYGYKKRMLLIDKVKLTTLMVNFYNLKGKKFKVLKNSSWKKTGKTYRPSLSIMSRKNHKTYIKSTKRMIDSPIKNVVFSKRYLEKEMHMN